MIRTADLIPDHGASYPVIKTSGWELDSPSQYPRHLKAVPSKPPHVSKSGGYHSLTLPSSDSSSNSLTYAAALGTSITTPVIYTSHIIECRVKLSASATEAIIARTSP